MSTKQYLDIENGMIEGSAAIAADKPRVLAVEDSAEMEVADKMGAFVYHAHWQVFVPTLVILISYAVGLISLYLLGMTSSALFRLGALVIGIGVPLLGVHAFLRFNTVGLQLLDGHLRYHKGWPEDEPVDVPYDLIADFKIRRGLAGIIFGGGTIVLELTTGAKISIADIFEPQEAKAEFIKLRN